MLLWFLFQMFSCTFNTSLQSATVFVSKILQFLRKYFAEPPSSTLLPLNWTVNLQVYSSPFNSPKNIFNGKKVPNTEIKTQQEKNPTNFFLLLHSFPLLNNILLAGFGSFFTPQSSDNNSNREKVLSRNVSEWIFLSMYALFLFAFQKEKLHYSVSLAGLAGYVYLRHLWWWAFFLLISWLCSEGREAAEKEAFTKNVYCVQCLPLLLFFLAVCHPPACTSLFIPSSRSLISKLLLARLISSRGVVGCWRPRSSPSSAAVAFFRAFLI